MATLINKEVINVPFKVSVTLWPDFKHTLNFTIDLMKQTSIRFHENPSDQWILYCSMRPNGQTDRVNEANGRFSQL
jgi:hypothetical protein